MISTRKRPCGSCPYRKDCPSGLWAADEYRKLPDYDGSTEEQAAKGALGAFHCHTTSWLLCAGWVSVHDMYESLAMRLLARRGIDPAVYDYESPVPTWSSGAEAAEHGQRDIKNPGPAARAKIRQLTLLRARMARRRPG